MNNKNDKLRQRKVEEAVHKTVNELVNHLSSDSSDDEYIHQIRVHIKRLRAWVRLQRIKNKELNWKEMDELLRNHARTLGQARDTQIVIEKLEEFYFRAKTNAERSTIKRAIKYCNIDSTEIDLNLPKLKHDLLSDLETYRDQYISTHTIDQMRSDLKKYYKRTIKSAKRAYALQSTFDDLHRFRKDVKTLNYLIGYMNKGFKNNGKSIKSRISELGEVLGHIHDVDVIQNYINSVPPRNLYKTQRKIMATILERELEKLLLDSKLLFNKAFRKKPEDFISFMK